MKRALIALPLVALMGATTGCPNPESSVVPTLPPSASPSWTPPSTSPTGAYSDSGIEVSGGSLYLEVKGPDGAAVPGATLRLYGPTLAIASTDAQGQATLGPLATGDGYRLVVEAPGFATSQVGNITINKNEVTAERPNLSRGASLGGRILADGKPVAGAVVSDGLNSALTDASGSYSLGGVTPGQVTITASKSRFKTVSRELSVATGGATGIDLSISAVEPVVYFDATVSSGVSGNQLATLKESLKAAGWTISPTPPASEGVWMLFSPSKVPDSDAAGRIANFVAQGGKLVIFGEWGGFAGFNNPGANAIAHQVGLHFNPDLVRTPGTVPASEWLTIRNFQPGLSALADVSTIQLYSACSLFALSPMTALAQTGADAYRIQQNGLAGVKNVVMGGPYKAGKAIALGDASGFLDESTNGAVNAKQGDNLKLVAKLLDW